jgi:uncharacterized iron-regulated membrane protein
VARAKQQEKNMKYNTDHLPDCHAPGVPESNNARLARLKARRKLWLDVHLYLGLSAGFILAIVGLTGSILVFYQEMQDVVNPELALVSAPPEGVAAYRSLDEIIAAADSVRPEGSRIKNVYYPRHQEAAFKLLYYVQAPGQSDRGDGYYIFVDPYTAHAQGMQLWHPKGRYWGRPLVSFIMQLHWCLLLGKNGGVIVGILAVLSIISVLTGLIVWWPLTGKFRQALTFKRHAGAVRFNFDLHKTVGFYSTIVLLAVLFSGVYFNLPAQVNTLVKLFSPLERPDAWTGIDEADYRSTVRHDGKPLDYAQIEASVHRHYPSGKIWKLNAPQNEQDVYKVWKKDVIEIGPFIGYRELIVDQYSGEILKVYDSGTGSAGDILLDWQWPLHSGHAFGWPGRILVLLSGLACPVLFVTGVIRWLQKRKAKSHRRPVVETAAGR